MLNQTRQDHHLLSLEGVRVVDLQVLHPDNQIEIKLSDMKRRLVTILLLPGVLLANIDFNRQIRPILSEHCFACHGLDDPQGGLRLDFAEFAYKGGGVWISGHCSG